MAARKLLGWRVAYDLSRIQKSIHELSIVGLESSINDHDMFYVLFITLNKRAVASIGYQVIKDEGKPYAKLGSTFYENPDIYNCYEKLSEYIQTQLQHQ